MLDWLIVAAFVAATAFIVNLAADAKAEDDAGLTDKQREEERDKNVW